MRVPPSPFRRPALSPGVKSIAEAASGAVKPRFGCLMLSLPDALAGQIQAWASSVIDPAHLAPDGVEDYSHVTLKYGFGPGRDVAAKLGAILTRNGPVPARLTSLSLFPDGGDGEVLKIGVESEDLHALYHLISGQFDCSDRWFPDYKPHVTVAYLRPGYGAAYAALKCPACHSGVLLDRAVYSDPSKLKTTFRLLGAKALSWVAGGGADLVKPPEFMGPKAVKPTGKLFHWRKSRLRPPRVKSLAFLTKSDPPKPSDGKHPGDLWQGPSGAWFTMNPDGHVVHAKDPNKKEEAPPGGGPSTAPKTPEAPTAPPQGAEKMVVSVLSGVGEAPTKEQMVEALLQLTKQQILQVKIKYKLSFTDTVPKQQLAEKLADKALALASGTAKPKKPSQKPPEPEKAPEPAPTPPAAAEATPAPPEATPEAPPPADEAPPEPDDLMPGTGFPPEDQLKLKGDAPGGSTGAKIYEDNAGNKYVVKNNKGNAGHLKEEMAADALYKAAGVAVPDSQGMTIDGKTQKVAKWVDGVPLKEYLASASASDKKKVLAKIRANFVVDAFLGNRDVIGMEQGNIVVTPDGQPVRIDNGGSLRYRAQGELKSHFGSAVTDLINLQDKSVNPQGAKIFGKMDPAEVKKQIQDLLAKKDAILAATPENLKGLIESRLAFLEDHVSDNPTKSPKHKFTGIDALGRQWVNGELQKKAEEPAVEEAPAPVEEELVEFPPPGPTEPVPEEVPPAPEAVPPDEDGSDSPFDPGSKADQYYEGLKALVSKVKAGESVPDVYGALLDLKYAHDWPSDVAFYSVITQSVEALKKQGLIPPDADVMTNTDLANAIDSIAGVGGGAPTSAPVEEVPEAPASVEETPFPEVPSGKIHKDSLEWEVQKFLKAAAESGTPMPPEQADAVKAFLSKLKGEDIKNAADDAGLPVPHKIKMKGKVIDYLLKRLAAGTGPGGDVSHLKVNDPNAQQIKKPPEGGWKESDKNHKYGADWYTKAGYDTGNPNANIQHAKKCPPLTKGLTDEEKAALRWYTTGAYKKLNLELYKKDKANLNYEQKENYKLLTSAFAKAPPFDEPLEVYRKLNFQANELEQFIELAKKAQMEGGAFVQAGFNSCTTDPATWSGNVRLVIQARHGINVKPISANAPEDEVLLPENAAIRVSRVVQAPDGNWNVYCEQLTPDEIAAQKKLQKNPLKVREYQPGPSLPHQGKITNADKQREMVEDMVKWSLAQAGTDPKAALSSPSKQSQLFSQLKHHAPGLAEWQIEQSIKNLVSQQADKLIAPLFAKHGAKNQPSQGVPDEARPQDLTDQEKVAIQKYTGSGFRKLNAGLRNDAEVEQWAGEMHKGLQSAFAKAQPFKEPVPVTRELNIPAGADLEGFLSQMHEAAKGGGVMRMPGYNSTSTSGTIGHFKGNVSLKINAVHGIDVRPYGHYPHESELLLNHNAGFKITGVKKVPDASQPGGFKYEVQMDQVLGDASAEPAVHTRADLFQHSVERRAQRDADIALWSQQGGKVEGGAVLAPPKQKPPPLPMYGPVSPDQFIQYAHDVHESGEKLSPYDQEHNSAYNALNKMELEEIKKVGQIFGVNQNLDKNQAIYGILNAMHMGKKPTVPAPAPAPSGGSPAPPTGPKPSMPGYGANATKIKEYAAQLKQSGHTLDNVDMVQLKGALASLSPGELPKLSQQYGVYGDYYTQLDEVAQAIASGKEPVVVN